MRKRAIAIPAIMILVLAGVYVGSAYWTVHSFRQAIQNGDPSRLAATVDFPAVRASLKPQLAEALSDRLTRDSRTREDPLAQLGAIFAPAIVGRSVDALVTPDGIAALVQGERPLSVAIDRPAVPAKLSATSSWQDPSHLRVRLRNDATGKTGPSLLFEHRGIVAWKLVRLDLPAAAAREDQAGSRPPSR